MSTSLPNTTVPISDQITSAVTRFSDFEAVRTNDESVTYNELGKLIDEFSSSLRDRTTEGDFIGITSERCLSAIVAMLSSLTTRRAFVFIDQTDSDEKNADKAERLNIRWVVNCSASPRDPNLTELPNNWDRTRSETPNDAGSNRALQKAAYAIYTSGSTGEPKCVLVAPDALGPIIAAHVSVLGLKTGKRTLQFARLTFDGCITEILWTLTSGATLVVLDESKLSPGSILQSTLEANGITHVKTTPFALTSTEPSPEMALEHVINGGGACRPAAVKKWSQFSAFHNSYGLTETTICNFLSRPIVPSDCEVAVPLGDFVGEGTFSIKQHSHELNRSGRGELVLHGDCVALGYLHERGFMSFAEENGSRLFETGDLVESLDEKVFFVERVDRQLKIRGFRIDPGEVENSACQIDEVEEAIALQEDYANDDGNALVLYFRGDNISERMIREHLVKSLDAYKVPSIVSKIEEIPYTANGKVDKDALKHTRLLKSNDSNTNNFVAHPVIASIQNLTGINDVSGDDNFFDLGGDSASALVLVEDLKKMGWKTAGVKDVLRAADVNSLIDDVEEAKG